MKYPHDHENDVIYFGKTNFRNSMRKFGIKTDDRRRHTYVIGKTGMGKTTLLENMILSDIYAGHGCCYIDPHGDTAEKLIDYIPSWRINDVVYFNPSDVDYPVGFNILESIDDSMKHLVAAGMMGVFKKLWEGVWSARMEYILNNTILALMDTPGTTLLGINRMLSDEEYRNQIIMNVTDPIVKQFWVKEFGSYQQKFASEAVAPIQNKVGQFLSASIIRNIVAQAKSAMNVRQVMDDEKIFIVNLSKGRIGEDASRLLGGLIITKIQMSAMERVDVPEDQRNDFYMYVDEFQNFAVESFASILSEARKYRLNLIMAHQYIAQLTEEVRDAVFGNVGTLISFRVGSPDAAFMEDEFMPRFIPEDIINLPKYNIYLKLMIDGVTSQPFSAATLPPIAVTTHSTDKVIEQSRERYSGNRQKIEDNVATWSGFGADVDVAEEMAKVKTGNKQAKKARFSHSYDCTRCNKTFQLPVELDRSRPIYCEDCHPLVMEERKSGGGKRDDSKKKRDDEKRVVDKPPKVNDGERVEKKMSDDRVSLDSLVDGGGQKKDGSPEAAPDAPSAKQDSVADGQVRASQVEKKKGPVQLDLERQAREKAEAAEKAKAEKKVDAEKKIEVEKKTESEKPKTDEVKQEVREKVVVEEKAVVEKKVETKEVIKETSVPKVAEVKKVEQKEEPKEKVQKPEAKVGKTPDEPAPVSKSEPVVTDVKVEVVVTPEAKVEEKPDQPAPQAIVEEKTKVVELGVEVKKVTEVTGGGAESKYENASDEGGDKPKRKRRRRRRSRGGKGGGDQLGGGNGDGNTESKEKSVDTRTSEVIGVKDESSPKVEVVAKVKPVKVVARDEYSTSIEKLKESKPRDAVVAESLVDKKEVVEKGAAMPEKVDILSQPDDDSPKPVMPDERILFD